MPTNQSSLDHEVSELAWRICEPRSLAMRTYGDETLVFDSRSGHTHLLNRAAAHCLQKLSVRAATPSELARNRAGSSDDTSCESAADVRRLLKELAALGVAEPVSGSAAGGS